jgi:hypothetical protein
MKLTKHASKRKRQRGFSGLTLDIILKHGREDKAAGGATRVSFSPKEYQTAVGELKRAIQLMDRARGGSLVILDGHVLTVYKKGQ